MKNLPIFLIAPLLLFLFLILINDLANAVGGVFIYMLVMGARFLLDKFIKRKGNDTKGSGN